MGKHIADIWRIRTPHRRLYMYCALHFIHPSVYPFLPYGRVGLTYNIMSSANLFYEICKDFAEKELRGVAILIVILTVHSIINYYGCHME